MSEKDWMIRFKKMLEVLELDYSDVADLSGNSYNSVKNITAKGVPRNMKFAIEVFELMDGSKVFEIDGQNDGELISIKKMSELRSKNAHISGRDINEKISSTDIVIVR